MQQLNDTFSENIDLILNKTGIYQEMELERRETAIMKERDEELMKFQALFSDITWNNTMDSNVEINDKIVTNTGSNAYCYLGLPLRTDSNKFNISWSFKITKR